MKTFYTLIISISALCAFGATNEQGVAASQQKIESSIIRADDPTPYDAREFDIQFFGTGRFDDLGDLDDVKFGYGAQVSYFLNANLGLSADTILESMSGKFFEEINFGPLIRAPLKVLPEAAPYLYVGPQHSFEREEWAFFTEGGIEYRRGRLGAFIGLRWLTRFEPGGEGIIRTGLNFNLP